MSTTTLILIALGGALPGSPQSGTPVTTKVNFDTEIIPILTKAGCNTGACHGAAAGRGEFRLSLYGGDPAFDYRSIVLELEGRRVNLASPKESLVLLKPTSTIKHGGGARLRWDGDGAKLLEQWIAGGADRQQTKQLQNVRVSPETFIAKGTGESIQLQAFAEFTDDTSREVTEWTVFTPEDPASIQVDEKTGTATLLRRGRHIIVARYLDRVIPIQVIVPLSDEPVDLSAEPRRNFIDEHVLELLTQLRVPVSPPAQDEVFLRRLTLSLTGRLPTLDEIQAFKNDDWPDKRDHLIDQLLGSEAFTDYWTYQFAKLLRIQSQPNDSQGADVYHQWLRKQIHEGVPYNKIARDLLTAEGDSHLIGPANFYRTVGGPREQAEFVSELFMGNRLRCANCHNHPLDRWTQDDYHGLAAVFAPIERGRVIRVTSNGEVTHPRTGEAAIPRIPGTRFLETEGDGREAVADWLTHPDNPYFARAIVNRLWKVMMGRGLVEPTDDLRETNPATHPALLNQLANDFVEHGYDIRHTLRLIAQSNTYARSGTTVPGNRADDRYYSHALVRPLQPEVLADAISDITGVPGQYGEQPLGTRAVTLVDPKTPSEALDILGRCSRDDSCETVGGTVEGLPRMLHLYNGELLNARIEDRDGRLAKFFEDGTPSSEIIEEFYLRALGREPLTKEQEFWEKQMSRAEDDEERKKILEDFLWGLLNCQEFVTNH